MDFSLSEEQTALVELARRIFREHPPDESGAEVGETHAALWKALARGELLGLGLPPEVGGAGLGFIELVLLLEQAGFAAVTSALYPTLVLGALPIATFGSSEQKERLLRPVVAGELLLSAALADTTQPFHARADGPRFRLDGRADCVPWVEYAGRVLVPARTESGKTRIFIVDPRGSGARIERQLSTNDEPLGQLELSGAPLGPGDLLGEPEPERGPEMLGFMLDHARVGLCALALGAAERALELTARYTTERQQFDRPIATFQAVSQRAADAYVDVESMRLTMLRAAFLLSQAEPATAEVAIAKYTAAESGQRVVNAAQHLHGGIGFDRSYPLHRYFLLERQIEFTLGSASRELARLGALIAEG